MKKRKGISTIIGTMIFLVLFTAAVASLGNFMGLQFELLDTEREMTALHNIKIHEDFKFSDAPDGVCVDPANSRLFVEVDNLGANPIQFVDLMIINSSQATAPVALHDINYSDAWIPFGYGGSVLSNQPLYMDFGTYDIKLVTINGLKQVYKNLVVGGGEGTGDFIDAFVTAGSGGLNGPEGLVFHTDGNLYVASENSHEILKYDGTDGTFLGIFADLDPTGVNSDCKKPLGIEFGPDGHLYIASEDEPGSDVICRVDGNTGVFIDYFVTDGLGGMTDPTDVAFGPDGNLYVTSEPGGKVYRYDGSTGAFIDVFANAGMTNPKFLTFYNSDLYVSSGGNDKVIQFDDTSGAHKTDYVVPSTNRPNDPEGIVFDSSGNLYVSSEGSDEILMYDTAGLFKKVFVSAGSGGLNEPADLVFGPDGNLYVSSELSDEILRYDGTGINPGAVPSCDGFTCANGCPSTASGTTSNSGFLFVSSSGTHEILEYTETGAFSKIFVTQSQGGLNDPSDLVFGSDNHLYVASSDSDQILRYDGTTGATIDVFVAAGSGTLDEPEGLRFHTDGNLYVASYNNHKILKYDGTTGASLGTFADLDPAGTISDCHKPIGIEFGSDGHLYAASGESDVVCRYDGTTGAFMDFFVTDGLGGLSGPQDLTFGPDGNLYVASGPGGKVYRYNGSTGAFIDVFSSGISNAKYLIFKDNSLFISSEINDKIHQHDYPSGAFNNNFVDPSDNGGLDAPDGITFKP